MDAFGTVIDATTGDTLPGVNIAVLDGAGNLTGHGTTTDANGIFDLRGIAAGRAVQFSMLGYRTELPTLRAFPEQNTVIMEQQAVQIPWATVSAKRTYTWVYVTIAVAVVLYVIYRMK